MNILTIGAGAYGLALSTILNEKNEVTVYSSIEKEIDELKKTYKKETMFPNIELPKTIKFTNKIEEKYDLIILALPTNIIEQELEKIKQNIKDIPVIITSKGIHKNKLPYEIVKEILNPKELYVILGPSFAKDVIEKQTISLTLAPKKIPDIFNKEYVKIETTEDILGVELCGIIKNIFAIAAGILEGLNVSESTKAAFLTKIINETKQIIKKLGGNENTIFLSCGIGDILLTCTSKNSRNFKLGYIIGQEKNKKEIDDYINSTTIEGLKSLTEISEDLKKEKIIKLIHNIIYNGKNPKELIKYISEW